MNKEFEKIQLQIKDLKSKKVSRQKNQSTPEYKALLKNRRQIIEEIMALEEQKEMISRDNVDISELIIEINVDYSEQKQKIENDKQEGKISKRTYNKLLKNLSDRYDAKMRSLEMITDEMLASNKEDIISSCDEKINQLRNQYSVNEEEINKLKLNNENKNLEIDRQIYTKNKNGISILENEISGLEQSIEKLQAEIGATVDTSDLKYVELTAKKEMLEELQIQRDELVKEQGRFTKKTLAKIHELEAQKISVHEEPAKQNISEEEVVIEEETRIEQDNSSKEKFDVRFGEEYSAVLEEQENPLNDVKLKGPDTEIGLKMPEFLSPEERRKTAKVEIPGQIHVTLMLGANPYLKYSTYDEDGTNIAGDGYYTMKLNKYAHMKMVKTYNEVMGYLADDIDEKKLKAIDPFLLDYLAHTNGDLYDRIIDEIEEGRGLESLQDIITYDMRDYSNLKLRDKLVYGKIFKNSEKNGFKVNKIEEIEEVEKTEKKSIIARLFARISKKQQAETEVVSGSSEKDRVRSFKQEYEEEYDEDTTGRPIRPIGRAVTMAATMKFVKGREER